MTEAVHRTPKTERGAQTRDDLLEAAQDVFWDKGYIATRVADIVERAGVSHGSFYTYFDSKEAVLWALASDLHEILTDAGTGVRAEVGGDEVRTIELATRRYLDNYMHHRRITRLMEDVAVFNPDMRAARLHTRELFVHRVERSIRRLQEAGKADVRLDASYASEALVSMVSHFAYHAVVTRRDLNLDTAVETLTIIWAQGIGLRVD